MWKWVQQIKEGIPSGYKANSIPEDKRVGGFEVSGLVLNFTPVAFHHDTNGKL